VQIKKLKKKATKLKYRQYKLIKIFKKKQNFKKLFMFNYKIIKQNFKKLFMFNYKLTRFNDKKKN